MAHSIDEIVPIETPGTKDPLQVAYQTSSRTSAVLSGLSAILLMTALLWSYVHLRRANAEYASIEEQVSQKRRDIASLEQQKQILDAKVSTQIVLVNDLVSNNQQAVQTLSKAAETSTNLAQAVPRVFLHTRKSRNTNLVKRVADEIRMSGFVVPGPDEFSNNFFDTSLTEIQFFGNDPATGKDLQQLKLVLASLGIPMDKVYTQLDTYDRHPPRTYAIYLPKEN